MPLIDKDDILDRLFESKGGGNAAWRRTLSRESDVILQQEATNSAGANFLPDQGDHRMIRATPRAPPFHHWLLVSKGGS
jgi:hypothetical protein